MYFHLFHYPQRQKFSSSYSDDHTFDELKKLVEEQGKLIMQQQEKIEELEKRIHQLEQP